MEKIKSIKREKTSFTVDRELWKQFQKEIIDRGLKSTDALDEAISQWIHGVFSKSTRLPHAVDAELSITEATKKWHEYLSAVLNSDVPQAREAIQHNLRMFALAVDLMQAQPPRRSKTAEQDQRLAEAFRRFMEIHPLNSPVRRAFERNLQPFLPPDDEESKTAITAHDERKQPKSPKRRDQTKTG